MQLTKFRKIVTFVCLAITAIALGPRVDRADAMNLNDIDPGRRTDWRQAGYPGQIPDITANIIDVKMNGATGNGITDDSSVIQSLIDDATPPAVIYFPPGVYRLRSTLNVKSGIVLRGDGSQSTRLDFEGDRGCIYISGTTNGGYTSILNGLDKGSDQITVADPSRFQVGQGGEIRQEDIDAVDPAGDWAKSGWVPDHVVGQMVKIKAINGNILTIDPPLNLTLSVDKQPEILPVRYVTEVGIEDLHLHSINAGTGANNININRAADCWVRRVESDNTQKYHVSVAKSLHLEIRDSYIHDAVTKGDGGAGYGVSLSTYTTAVLVENNIFNELRHSMIIQLGVNGSVFGYNYARRNYSDDGWDKAYISIHGHYPYMNLFEGNIVGIACLADYWGASGPGNTLFRNRVIGTDKHKDFGPYRGITIDDYSHKQNIIGNELTGAQTAITFDGSTDISQGTSRDLLVHGNNVHGTIAWDAAMPSDHTLPASFYLSAKPAFFDDMAWPAMGPDQELNANTIPAEKRWNSGNFVPQPGSPPVPSIPAPANLRVVE